MALWHRQLLTLQDKLSIYPQQDKEVTAVETSTELERQVGQVRQALQRLSSNLFGSIRSGVDSVVRIEDKVERTCEVAHALKRKLTYFRPCEQLGGQGRVSDAQRLVRGCADTRKHGVYAPSLVSCALDCASGCAFRVNEVFLAGHN